MLNCFKYKFRREMFASNLTEISVFSNVKIIETIKKKTKSKEETF